jgi:hypothetical protein
MNGSIFWIMPFMLYEPGEKTEYNKIRVFLMPFWVNERIYFLDNAFLDK